MDNTVTIKGRGAKDQGGAVSDAKDLGGGAGRGGRLRGVRGGGCLVTSLHYLTPLKS